MRFYLSKADEAGHESDRQRVMMQIVQELCKRPGLNKTGFDMPTIYIPNPSKPSRCANQIDEVCKDIEKTINQTIQNTLNKLEEDCEKIATIIDDTLEQDKVYNSFNMRARLKGMFFTFMALTLPLILFVNFLASSASKDLLHSVLGKPGTETLYLYLAPVRGLWKMIPATYHLYVIGGLTAFVLLLLLLAKLSSRRKPTLARRQKRELNENQEYVRKFVKNKKQTLYQEYLKQSVADHDL